MYKAGLGIGDVIIAINGKLISTAPNFDERMREANCLGEVNFTLLRLEDGVFNR
jgi:S1-C subfamily serine protease